jgi:hypothetical protein
MRICRKVPDLQEHFLDKAKVLLSDRNHGVLLCGLTLVTSMCEADEAEEEDNGVIEMFRPLVPALVKIVKSLANAGYTPEHDVNGISDPFLQVKIINLFRVLARGDAHTSEQINDSLAQVCIFGSYDSIFADEAARSQRTPMAPRTLETPSSTKQFYASSTSRQIQDYACSASTFWGSSCPTRITISVMLRSIPSSRLWLSSRMLYSATEILSSTAYATLILVFGGGHSI